MFCVNAYAVKQGFKKGRGDVSELGTGRPAMCFTFRSWCSEAEQKPSHRDESNSEGDGCVGSELRIIKHPESGLLLPCNCYCLHAYSLGHAGSNSQGTRSTDTAG